MNLALLNDEELMKFHDETRRHPRKAAAALFPTLPAGAVAAARDLANYAVNLATARSCKAEGREDRAEVYQKICARIKLDLPDYALPILGD